MTVGGREGKKASGRTRRVLVVVEPDFFLKTKFLPPLRLYNWPRRVKPVTGMSE